MTIMHPRFRQLRAFAAEELSPDARRKVATHLARCTRCRGVVSSLRELVAAVREETAWELPEGAWDGVLARRAAGERVVLPVADPAAPRPVRGTGGAPVRALPRAAILVLGVAGIASASLLASPLRSLWEDVRQSGPAPAVVAPPGGPGEGSGSPPAVPRAAEAPTAGMLVQPSRGAVEVAIEQPHPDVRIRVRLGEGTRAGIRATGAASGALFRTGPGRAAIVQPGPGEVLIELPRDLRSAVLRVDGKAYLRKEGRELRVLVPDTDTAGAELILRVQP